MFLKYLCEFLGTMMLILLGDGVVANVTLNKSGMKGAGSIQITLAWGLAVMVPAFIFGEASGASFNPALTIALAVGGMFDWALVPGYVIAQILGGIVGGVLVYILFKDLFKYLLGYTAVDGTFFCQFHQRCQMLRGKCDIFRILSVFF